MLLTCEFSDDLMLWSDAKLKARYLGDGRKGTAGINEKKKKKKRDNVAGPKSLESKIDVKKMQVGKKNEMEELESVRMDGPADEHTGERWESRRFQVANDGSYEEVSAKYNV